MRERNWQIILLLSILAIVLLGWTLYLKESPKQPMNIAHNSLPDYKSGSMYSTVYDTTGDLLYKLQSDEVTYYKKEQITLFVNPVLTLYNPNLKPEWRITANKAKLSGKTTVYLLGDVKAINLGSDSQIQSISTEQAKLNLITQDISSDKKVKIQGKQFHSQGVGLTGNLKQKKATLLSEVNTYYE